MGDSIILGERRRALRVPVRGVAVLYARRRSAAWDAGKSFAMRRAGKRCHPHHPRTQLDIELRLAEGGGWVVGRVVRVEPHARQWRVALAFDRVDESLRGAVDASIASARGAARRRPILVIDENTVRKNDLISRLSDCGMTPLAPEDAAGGDRPAEPGRSSMSVCASGAWIRCAIATTSVRC